MEALVFMLRQDDPYKCTAAKLVKFRLAKSVKFIRPGTLVLNPFSEILLSKKDTKISNSVCAIDCSWELAANVLKHQQALIKGIERRLPAMLAGNPIYYSKIGKLSTAEALAGSFY